MCAGSKKLLSHCQHFACIIPVAVTDDYYRHICRKSPCLMSHFSDYKTAVTHFELILTSNMTEILRIICDSAFKEFEALHYQLIIIY